MGGFLRRNEVWVFFCGIVLVNAVFVTSIAYQLLPDSLYQLGRFLLLGGVLVTIVFLSRGTAGIYDMLRPMLRFRVALPWYLLAILWGAANAVLVLVLKGLVSGNGLAEVTLNFRQITRPSVAAIVFVGSFIGEIVWISYAVRQLSGRFTTYVSCLIVGAFWTAWWVPQVIYNVGVIEDLPIVWLLINQMGVAAMCGFFYMHTKSGVVVLAMQFAFNSCLLVFPIQPATGGVPTYASFAVTYFLTALAMYLWFGPKPLFNTRDSANRAERGEYLMRG